MDCRFKICSQLRARRSAGWQREVLIAGTRIGLRKLPRDGHRPRVKEDTLIMERMSA